MNPDKYPFLNLVLGNVGSFISIAIFTNFIVGTGVGQLLFPFPSIL